MVCKSRVIVTQRQRKANLAPGLDGRSQHGEDSRRGRFVCDAFGVGEGGGFEDLSGCHSAVVPLWRSCPNALPFPMPLPTTRCSPHVPHSALPLPTLTSLSPNSPFCCFSFVLSFIHSASKSATKNVTSTSVTKTSRVRGKTGVLRSSCVVVGCSFCCPDGRVAVAFKWWTPLFQNYTGNVSAMCVCYIGLLHTEGVMCCISVQVDSQCVVGCDAARLALRRDARRIQRDAARHANSHNNVSSQFTPHTATRLSQKHGANPLTCGAFRQVLLATRATNKTAHVFPHHSLGVSFRWLTTLTPLTLSAAGCRTRRTTPPPPSRANGRCRTRRTKARRRPKNPGRRPPRLVCAKVT